MQILKRIFRGKFHFFNDNIGYTSLLLSYKKLASDNFKEPVDANFDDCTKDILKEPRKVIQKKIASRWQAVEMNLSAFREAIFVSNNT